MPAESSTSCGAGSSASNCYRALQSHLHIVAFSGGVYLGVSVNDRANHSVRRTGTFQRRHGSAHAVF
jgi:hypothetical protein